MIELLRRTTWLAVATAFCGSGLAGVRAPSSQTQAVQSYCAQIDQYVGKYGKSFLEFRRSRGRHNDGDGPWRKSSVEEASDELDSNGAARVWQRRGDVVLVVFTIQSDSRDWALFVSNYYRQDGTLAKLKSELNTFYGDLTVERTWLYSTDGTVLDFKARYYKLTDHTPSRLNDDYIDEAIPLYSTVGSLPFYGLMTR